MKSTEKTPLELQLQGYQLTTAEILYHLPDYPRFLQVYIWQEYDLGPQYPRLSQFLTFWEKNLDGKVYAVKVASAEGLFSNFLGYGGTELTLH